MNKTLHTRLPHGRTLLAVFALLVLALGAPAVRAQQQTAGGTAITNQASASYSDGSNSYTTTSNVVTVTVANVSSLSISPDDTTGGSNPTVVSGQQNVDFTFTVTNSSNFDTQVRFLQSGASVRVFGPATVVGAVIDVGPVGYDAGDTDIYGNSGGDVLSAVVPRTAPNNTIRVIVRVNINAAAAPNDIVNVRLGDASGDNVSTNGAAPSANEVRTASGAAASAPVNGESEALGDGSARVENDAQMRLDITAPGGPVALGSTITYTYDLTNTGSRPASAQTLDGAPAGSNTGVFVIVPVPVGTDFSSVTPPGGTTVLYSVSPITNDPLAVATVWTTAPPASGVTRVAFRVGPTLGVGAAASNLQLAVTVQTTVNASLPIYAIGDAFAQNTVGGDITDQSGDAISSKGDGNANFNEPRRGVPPTPDEAVSATQGYQVPTTLTLVGNVLIGPAGFPAAVGPTGNNDDYTNKSVAPAIVAGLGSGAFTSANAPVDFVNTISNTGNGNDTYTITAPAVPAGFTVAVDTGSGFVDITAGSTTVAVNFGQTANVTVRVTALSGRAVLTGFAVRIRATSANSAASNNETIDRVYTGFLRLTKTATVFNNTQNGNGQDDPGADDAVPGAEIEYAIVYENVSNSGDPLNPTAGTNCVQLTASSIVITENGAAAPNNWAATTTQVVGSASDTNQMLIPGIVIAGDAAGSSLLTDSIPTLAPGQSGTFRFRRLIN